MMWNLISKYVYSYDLNQVSNTGKGSGADVISGQFQYPMKDQIISLVSKPR